MQIEAQKQRAPANNGQANLQTARSASIGNAAALQEMSASLNGSPAAMLLSERSTQLQLQRVGTLQLYDIRAFDSWDEHVAWLLQNHVDIPADLSLQIGQIGTYVNADTAGVKAMYIPQNKQGLTEAGKQLSDAKDNGAIVISSAYLAEVGTLPKDERVVALLSTIRHELQHAENHRSGLVVADGTENAHNLDETIAHSENILNTQLGENSGDAPLWDQLEHLVQAEEYFGRATEEDTPLYQAAAAALANAKLKVDEGFGDAVEGTDLAPADAMTNYLDLIDFMDLNEGRKPAVKSDTMSEVLQGKLVSQPAVRQDQPNQATSARAGLPDRLRQGIEALSGLSMGHVSVHRNSSKPAQVNAHAYAQGSEIHLAPGQDQHLPHEAWHVVQQAQGRVRPTMRSATGAPINDDAALEREADVMGRKALSATTQMKARGNGEGSNQLRAPVLQPMRVRGQPMQLQGVTLALVMQAIGTGFRLTAGDTQQTSDDIPCLEGVKCHFSVLVDDPGNIHISYYPAGDDDYQSKILHYVFQWNSDTESFGPAGLIKAKWKPFIAQFSAFGKDAAARMGVLAYRIRQLLNPPAPVQPPLQAPVPAPVQAPGQQHGGGGGANAAHVPFGADYIPVPELAPGEAPAPAQNQRYFGGPFPPGDDFEDPLSQFKTMPGADTVAPVQRLLEIAHDDDSDEHMALDHAIASVFLMPPEAIADAVAAMREDANVTIRIGFSEHVQGDEFGFTQVDGNTINVHIDRDMLPVDEDEQQDEEEDAWDNAVRDSELQATIIHELVLHTIPAYQRLVGRAGEPDNVEAIEHGDVAAWQHVLGTAASVTPAVLFRTILDALSHSRWIAAPERQAFYGLIREAIARSAGNIGMIVEAPDLFIFTAQDCAHFVLNAGIYGELTMYDTQQFFEERERDENAEQEEEDERVVQGHLPGPDFIPVPALPPEEEPAPAGNERYFGGAFPPHGDQEDDLWQFKKKPGADRSAPMQLECGVAQRNGEGLSELAKEIAAGTVDIRDETLGLSEGQIEIINAILAQLESLAEVERALDEVEQMREAMYPEPIPLDTLIEFQGDYASPVFDAQQHGDPFGDQVRNTPGAGARLVTRLRDGLVPGAQVAGRAPLSGDETKAGVVSVNVIPASKGARDADFARFATKYRAGGAIPIAVEQGGDEAAADRQLLEQRALDSALLVIDPARLGRADIDQVQASSTDGGEVGLSGVPSAAIVAVLAPETLARQLEGEVDRYNISFVGAETGSAYSASARTEADFTYPSYEAALAQIFAANPDKVLLTHTTRLGLPNPARK